ncbi:SDR family NAD(P)-dependent oxidoreductase [Allonocardiopsis opalescens]|uniref:NAD(P)-dependent dehydrogenase (Short-subunit alcohol dehydrogenase family) n=1 Tax=Allonocardiopsis opalescens TaxID=1144618 RepID=A0A2T0Q5G6_9ACTN|nr:SDR family NAD(P)-dependent oxidoreductase [Allonocardiopsis opalescens]PRX99034.1 NAD(P)-dependent dehydrogenase (short-subunit alcohol dehydrogenase family) [Allonocardiopsis opalescens]
MQADTGTPRTVVISGGTDGMGRGLVLDRLARGDTVVAIGSSADKGRRLRADAEATGGAGRLHVLRADLGSVAENRRVVAGIRREFGAVDALVLCANRQYLRHRLTGDGVEATFALYYLSRYLLGHGLYDRLQAAPRPVVVNVAGPGTRVGAVHWDDLRLERRYSAVRAQLQAGRANDLLGVAFAERSAGAVPYVLYHPGFTATDLGGVRPPVRTVLRLLAAVAARPVAEAIEPLSRWIDAPPAAPLTADDRGKPVPLDLRTFDPAAARRLDRLTGELLAEAPDRD